MATGMYASVPCVLVWNSNNSAGHYKRATTTALQLMIANSGGFVATFIYPNADKPQFHKGHTVVLGLLVAAWFLYVPFGYGLMSLLMKIGLRWMFCTATRWTRTRRTGSMTSIPGTLMTEIRNLQWSFNYGQNISCFRLRRRVSTLLLGCSWIGSNKFLCILPPLACGFEQCPKISKWKIHRYINAIVTLAIFHLRPSFPPRQCAARPIYPPCLAAIHETWYNHFVTYWVQVPQRYETLDISTYSTTPSSSPKMYKLKVFISI